LMDHPRAVGEIVNVGGTEPVTIRDLAFMVKDMTHSSSEVVFVPYEEAYGPGFEDIQYRVPDTSKLRQLLSFDPTKRLSDIVDEVIRDRQTCVRPTLAEAARG
jgi:UDP-glucose 4-epimerase